MRVAGVIALLMAVGTASWGGQPEAPAPAGTQEHRAAWAAFVAPALAGSEGARTAQARQQAFLAAIPHMEAAVAADPENATYRASLAYICLVAGQYQKALEATNRGVELNRRDGLLQALRGQAEAAMAQMSPEDVGQRIGPALEAFDEASRLEADNALPLLQAASVAFDAGRADLAQPRIQQALARTNCTLYRISVPFDLGDEPAESISAWQYVQYGFWWGFSARCANVVAGCWRLGAEEEQAGRLAAAEERFQWALQVSRKVGLTEPHLFITVNMAIDLMEDSYGHLARVAEAQGNDEAERWTGESGVVQIGRGFLLSGLEEYQAQVAEGPPDSIEALLALENRSVTTVIDGIGLTEERPVPACAPTGCAP